MLAAAQLGVVGRLLGMPHCTVPCGAAPWSLLLIPCCMAVASRLGLHRCPPALINSWLACSNCCRFLLGEGPDALYVAFMGTKLPRDMATNVNAFQVCGECALLGRQLLDAEGQVPAAARLPSHLPSSSDASGCVVEEHADAPTSQPLPRMHPIVPALA